MKAEKRADIMHKFVESRGFSLRQEDIYSRFKKKGIDEVMGEIPKEAIPTVKMIMQVAIKDKALDNDPYSCLRYRCMLYCCMRKLNEECKEGEEKFIIPYGWWTDAIWMNVVWIIKLTNGMLAWKGDLSCEECMGGPIEDCPFCLTDEQIEEIKFIDDYVVSSG